ASIDKRFRWIVAHEMARELRRDEARRRRCTRNHIQNLFAFLHTPASREFLPKNRLLAGVVYRWIEEKLARLPIEGPSRESARDFLHILLCVAAVNAERVKLHQLAGIIFVEAALRLLLQALHQ